MVLEPLPHPASANTAARPMNRRPEFKDSPNKRKSRLFAGKHTGRLWLMNDPAKDLPYPNRDSRLT